MKKIAIFGVAAATLLGTSAAMAQSVDIGVGPRGPGVTIGDRYDRHGDYRRDREYRRTDGVVIRTDRYNDRDRMRRDRRDWDD